MSLPLPLPLSLPLSLRLLVSGLALLSAAPIAAAAAAAPRVVTDIAPVHSIVSAVMAGIGAPDLLLPPGASPHSHALRPSEAQAVEAADLIVWVGPALTPWLADPLAALGGDTPQLELLDAPGVTLLAMRESAEFELHADDETEAHGHDASYDETGAGAHGHDGGRAEAQETPDPHIWLDPANAVAIAAAAAADLAALDPGNAAVYEANAAAFEARLQALGAELALSLAAVQGRGFLVFHDAYQYFERAFDVPAAGAIALTDGAAPGAGRAAALRARILDAQVACVFAEPQFEPKLLAVLIEDSAARTGTLDPLGTDLPPGPDLYPALLRNLAASLRSCLEG